MSMVAQHRASGIARSVAEGLFESIEGYCTVLILDVEAKQVIAWAGRAETVNRAEADETLWSRASAVVHANEGAWFIDAPEYLIEPVRVIHVPVAAIVVWPDAEFQPVGADSFELGAARAAATILARLWPKA